MAQIGLITASAYYAITALWWLIQVTKRYHFVKQRHCDFTSTVAYPCCAKLQNHPIEGAFKVFSSLAIAIGLFCFNKAAKNDFLTNQEISTVFVFYMVSGVTDILAKWSGKTFHQGLDYIALMLFFSIQSVVLAARAQFSDEPVKMLYSLLLYTSLAILITTIMEMKYTDQVLCPIMRSYLLLILGTYGLQVALLMEDKAAVSTADPDKILMLAMYFSWHCGINFFVILSIWLIVSKLMQRQMCCCLPLDTASATDTIYLENRVHFDYHILDRFESDVE